MSTIAHHECRHSSDAKRNQPAFFLIVFLVSSIVNQSSSQAELPAGLKDRPWLHAVSDRDEWWISAERQVEAFRMGDQHFTFLNLKADEIDEYQASRGVIRRSRLRASQKDMTYVVFELLKGNENVDWPPSGNFIPTRTNSRIEIEGKKYTQIDFDLNEVTTTLVIKVTFRIDPETKLIESWTISSSDGDELKSKIDYLKEGPVDIYALGAPRDAKVISRIPSEKMQRIIDQTIGNRQHLNPYTAYILGTYDIKETLVYVYRTRRVGSRWLVEMADPKELRDLKSRLKKEQGAPTNEKDLITWWKSKVESLSFVPEQLSDGKIAYRFLPSKSGEPQFILPLFSVIGSVDPRPSFGMNPESMAYAGHYAFSNEDYASIEEISSIGPSGIIEVPNSIEENSSIGPPGMTLISRGMLPIGVSRTWLDPTRGNAAVRHEFEANGSIGATVAEELQQSPTGIWYATRVRSGHISAPGETFDATSTDKNGDRISTSVEYFVLDFDSPIPDDVFKTTATVRYPEQVEEEMK